MRTRALVMLVLLTALAVAAALPAAARTDGGAHSGWTIPAPTGVVVVRLADDSGLTMDDGGLAGPPAAAARLAATVARLAPGARLERRIALPAAAVRALGERAARRGGRAAPDLNRWAQLDAGTRHPGRVADLAAALARDPAVATAFAEPVAVPAALGFDAFTGAAPATASRGPAPSSPSPDFSGQQGYLGDAPEGVGALAVAGLPGARGNGLRVVDVEGAWLWAHEDLPDPFFAAGEPIASLSWRNHGTAVLGEMRGHDDGSGVRGIVPDAEVGGSSIGSQSVPTALASAAAALAPGDLILIELHAPGPNADGNGQFGYLPMEFWQDNFEAIQVATAAGIVVCEAAGNGQQDLDDPVYRGLFDRTLRDSGAILIGATDGGALSPAWFTNHGSRVDANGWGLWVTTTGYGDLQGGDDETTWYTAQFSGTSSASPIVTGAAASLQGMVDAFYGVRLDGRLVRHVLATTGTAVPGPPLIGARPDLVAAHALIAGGVAIVAGVVTEQGTGLPLPGVTVEAQPTGARTVTGADGAYQFVLLAGSYDVSFREFFHETAVVPITVGASPLALDVSLPLAELVTIAGTVVDEANGPVAGVTVTPLHVPVPAAVSGPDGAYSLGGVPAGVALTMVAGGRPGYGGAARSLDVPGGVAAVDVRLVLPQAAFTFESGAQGFTADGLWQRGDAAPAGGPPDGAFDGEFYWGVGLDGGGYPDDAGGTLSSPVFGPGDFATYPNLFLSFHYWLTTEAGFDGVQVQLAGGEVREPVGGYPDPSLAGLDYEPGWSGHTDGWRTAVFDLSDLLGQSWQFQLVFGSDGGLTDTGAFVDGFALAAHPTTPTAIADPPAAVPTAVLSASPNPFNPRATLAWTLPGPDRVDLRIYDPRGRLVAELLRDQLVPAAGSTSWDGVDDGGRAAPSGVYLARLTTARGGEATQRLVLSR